MLLIASGVARPPALRITPAPSEGPKYCSGTQRGSRQVTSHSDIILCVRRMLWGHSQGDIKKKYQRRLNRREGIGRESVGRKAAKQTDHCCCPALSGGGAQLAHGRRILPCLSEGMVC